MKRNYHAIGYLVILMPLSGCSTLAAMPFSPEITIKIGLKPALVVQKAEPDEISIEELQ